MGLLGDIFSTIDSKKRQLNGLLSDPVETIYQGVRNFGQEQQGLLDMQARAYPWTGGTNAIPDARARKELADAGAAQGMSASINTKALQEMFPGVDFSLSQRGNQAVLSKVVIPKDQRNQGVGSDFMSELTKAADIDGTQLSLSPSSDFGGNKARLVEFYKRFGFVPNKGRLMDFSISESMRRDPIGGN